MFRFWRFLTGTSTSTSTEVVEEVVEKSSKFNLNNLITDNWAVVVIVGAIIVGGVIFYFAKRADKRAEKLANKRK